MKLLTWTIFVMACFDSSLAFNKPRNAYRVSRHVGHSKTTMSLFDSVKVSPFLLIASSTLSSCKSNPWYVWSCLAFASTIGLYAESTKLGAMISSPLITTCTTLVMCNAGLLPLTSPCYNTVLKVFVPLAIPLLLLDADIKKCVTSTGSLMKSFLIGTIGTLIGTFVAYAIIPMRTLPGAEKIAAALCARHIGGAVNFVAVSDALSTPSEVVAAALAADNVVVALYFALIFYMAKPEDSPSNKYTKTKVLQRADEAVWEHPSPSPSPSVLNTAATTEEEATSASAGAALNTPAMSASILFAFTLCTLANPIANALSTSPIVVISALSVTLATMFPKTVSQLSTSGNAVGILLMQMFFAVTGAMGHIPTVIRVAPSLALHTLVQITVHLLFILGAGRVFRVPLKETLLASNANVGGPTTAAAMATSKGWKSLVLPALLVGVFGYAIATFIGISVAKILIAKSSIIGKYGFF